jgi:hypothetical protein
MKNSKMTLIFLLLFLLRNNLIAQHIAADVFKEETQITYLGVDFSNAKCFGEGATFDAAELTNKINNLIVTEFDKYNISKALKKPNLIVNNSLTVQLNNKIKENTFFTNNTSDLNLIDEKKIQEIISGYDFENYGKGIGFIFIVDNLNKSKMEEVVWTTFIDMYTKKVLFTEMMKAEPKGFGLRNYWSNPFEQIIGEIKKSELKKWKTKYGSKV